MPNRKETKDPMKDRGALREDEPKTTDDLETAEAKSRSVDERVPERLATDKIGVDAPVPASHIPAGRVPGPPVYEDEGEGERILEAERKALRTPKRPG